jgi:GT2 family glycosyltransferase
MPHELIVVDNGSEDGSSDMAAIRFPGAMVIENKRNLGFGRACNVGASAATGEYLFFLNPDAVVDPEAVGRLREVFEEYERVGLVSGRLRFPDGSFQPSCRRLPALKNLLFSRGSFLTRLTGGRSRFGASDYTLGDFPRITEVPAVSGTMLMVRRELFREVGGFDPRFFMYMEDTDLSLRAARAGFVNLFAPDSGAVHGWGRSSRTGRMRRRWYHHRSLWKYFRKYEHSPFVLFLALCLLAVNFGLVMFLPDRRSG